MFENIAFYPNPSRNVPPPSAQEIFEYQQFERRLFQSVVNAIQEVGGTEIKVLNALGSDKMYRISVSFQYANENVVCTFNHYGRYTTCEIFEGDDDRKNKFSSITNISAPQFKEQIENLVEMRREDEECEEEDGEDEDDQDEPKIVEFASGIVAKYKRSNKQFEIAIRNMDASHFDQIINLLYSME